MIMCFLSDEQIEDMYIHLILEAHPYINGHCDLVKDRGISNNDIQTPPIIYKSGFSQLLLNH